MEAERRANEEAVERSRVEAEIAAERVARE